MNPLEEKASRFRNLHLGPRILVLPNAWDAASARIFEQAGFAAIGTTSAGIANSLGYADGQQISREENLDAVRRIAHAVRVPVTADMEAGYAITPEDCARVAHAVIATGAIGMNFEDADQHGGVYDLSLQVEKIQAIRETAPHLVINARTDIFMWNIGEPDARLDAAVLRSNAYREAGADCLFIPGVSDAETIRDLVRGIAGPVNILAVPETPSIPELERLGVARVSVGSGPMRATLRLIQKIARDLFETGTFGSMADSIPYDEVNRMFPLT